MAIEKKSRALPSAPKHKIGIPRGLPELDGTLTRRERVAVALDVLAVFASRQRKFQLESVYFQTELENALPRVGRLHSSKIKGTCLVCARGLLFIKSVDRFDRFDLANEAGIVNSDDVKKRTRDDWGEEQARLIERAFEGYRDHKDDYVDRFWRRHGAYKNRKGVLRAICENIVRNYGELRLEKDEADAPTA